MMFKEYKEMSHLDFKINDKQIDKKVAEGLFIFPALLLRLVNPKHFSLIHVR